MLGWLIATAKGEDVDVAPVVRAGGDKVVPSCPFIKGWIDKHEDYADLVA